MRMLIVTAIATALIGCIDNDPSPEEQLGTETAALGCLAAPIAYGPSGVIHDRRPTYSWSAVDGATGYTVHVTRVDDDSRADRAITHGHDATSYLSRHDLLEEFEGVDLRWKVKGEGPCGAGEYSPSTPFRYEFREENPGPNNDNCFPSLQACRAVCTGTCERRINCGGPNAHKCFE